MNDEDVWVKEGLATVLQSEGDRSIRGGGSVPRLFGQDFFFGSLDLIVDPSLFARYTSEPNRRAAWMITQIRARIGDAPFWSRLRAILDANALGTLSGQRFLEGFAPALGAVEIAQLMATLESGNAPTIGMQFETIDNNRKVTVMLSDSDHQLLVPLALTVVDAAGTASVHKVRVGEPTVVSVPVDGYLAPDETDVNPSWIYFQAYDEPFFAQLTPLFAPSTPAGLSAFQSRSAAHQELTLATSGLPVSDPAGFAAFYAGLDSTLARRDAEAAVCRNATDAATGDAWRALVSVFIDRPAIESFSTQFAGCPAPQTAVDELEQLADAATPATARRLSYLLSFDYGPKANIDVIGKVATTAPSLQLREQALNRLAQLAFSTQVVDLAPWRALFRDQLAHAETLIRFYIAWRASRFDMDALPIVAARLHIYAFNDGVRRSVVCDAWGRTGG